MTDGLMTEELSRLRRQVTEAQTHVDRLLAQRQAALDGAGLMPSPKEVDRARAGLEVAEALLHEHARIAERAA